MEVEPAPLLDRREKQRKVKRDHRKKRDRQGIQTDVLPHQRRKKRGLYVRECVLQLGEKRTGLLGPSHNGKRLDIFAVKEGESVKAKWPYLECPGGVSQMDQK